MDKNRLRPLGKSNLLLSPIGLGAWQFSGSKGIIAKFWNPLTEKDAHEIIHRSISGGINWIDTAEAYGNGISEQVISHSLRKIQDHEKLPEIYIADKWWPLGRRASSITRTIGLRRSCLGGRVIDLYQIHHPTSVSTLKSQMHEMVKLVKSKNIRYVGVSNFTAKQMCKAHRLLKEEGITLISNQVRYNLSDRSIEKNGIMETAKELDVSIIAYSPLHQGLLTGKFHEKPELLNSLFWPRKIQYSLTPKTLQRTKPLIELLSSIGKKYNRTAGQVALNWLIHAHGSTVFAIPGASRLQHVQENIDAMNFCISPDEIQLLNEYSRERVLYE